MQNIYILFLFFKIFGVSFCEVLVLILRWFYGTCTGERKQTIQVAEQKIVLAENIWRAQWEHFVRTSTGGKSAQSAKLLNQFTLSFWILFSSQFTEFIYGYTIKAFPGVAKRETKVLLFPPENPVHRRDQDDRQASSIQTYPGLCHK